MNVDVSIENRQARLLMCIGEPTRLQIIKLLSQGEKCVGDICQAIGKDQPLISHHLRALRECGIIAARHETQKHYCHLADPILAELVMLSEKLVTELNLCPPESGCCKAEEVPDTKRT
jgi:ArsR family transcriptional regulator